MDNQMELKERKEYYDNGQLAFVETIVVLPTYHQHLYPYRVTNSDGVSIIRVGLQTKYHDNGVVAWELERNNKGEVIRSCNGYRNDGTPIIY